MKRKAQPHLRDLRNLRHSRFRDNTVINQGDAHIHLSDRPARAAIHVIPYPRNEDFINRPNIVTKLDELLPQSSDYYSAALCGLGGSGKTQIALDYIYRRCGTRSVFWVHADTKATIVNDYRVIANKFGISEGADDEALLMAVRSRIEDEPEWLLVLDNADDLSIFGVGLASASSNTLPDFIPKGPKGLVLWTSRDKRIMGTMVSARRAIEVGDMSLEEAEKLLEVATATTQNKAASEDIEDINKLLESLQYHALAISQAGAYMRRTSTSVREYTTMLAEKQKRHTLLKKSEFDRHRKLGAPNSILETWSISIKRIQQENEKAFSLFHIIAYFDNQNIPEDLVDYAGVDSGLWEEDDDGDDLKEALTRLKEFSLLSQGKDAYGDTVYGMHKLVQEAARYGLRMRKSLEKAPITISSSDVLQESKRNLEKDEAFFVMSALEGMAFAATEWYREEEHGSTVGRDNYLTHALQVFEWMELCGEGVEISNLLSDVSDLLGYIGSWKESELLNERILTMRRKILGEKHPDTIKSMAALATTYLGQAFSLWDEAMSKPYFECPTRDAQNHCDRAEKIGKEVIMLRRRILGPTHPDTITSLKAMIDVYCGQGRFNKARLSARKILKIQWKNHGEKHPGTLVAMEDLAFVLYTQGRCKRALRIREKVLKLQKETAGEEALVTRLAMYNLAFSWYQSGRRRDALTLMHQCLGLQQGFDSNHRLAYESHWRISEWNDELSESDIQGAAPDSYGSDEEMADG